MPASYPSRTGVPGYPRAFRPARLASESECLAGPPSGCIRADSLPVPARYCDRAETTSGGASRRRLGPPSRRDRLSRGHTLARAPGSSLLRGSSDSDGLRRPSRVVRVGCAPGSVDPRVRRIRNAAYARIDSGLIGHSRARESLGHSRESLKGIAQGSKTTWSGAGRLLVSSENGSEPARSTLLAALRRSW